MKIALPFAALALLAAAPAALADTIKVPSPGIATIQEAVDYAWPGDVILVGPGEYGDPVVILDRSGLEIRGTGRPTLVANIQILLSSEIVLRGLEFAGASVVATSSYDVDLVGLRFQDTVGSAVNVNNCDRFLVSRCQFRDIGGAGVDGEELNDLIVERCRFQDLAEEAVNTPDSLPGSNRVVFSRNRVLRAGGGILCNGEDLVVEDNRMAGLTGPGIDGAEPGNDNHGIYRRNRIETTHDYAIQNDGSDTVVERNTLVGGGIFLASQNVIVRGNRVTGAPVAGIRTMGTALLERNQVRGALLGIDAGGDNSTLVGNTVTGSSGAGISLGAEDCRISKNRVTGSGGVGLLLAGEGHLVTENRVSGSVTFDLADTAAEGVNTYEANRFGTVQFSYVP